jgi:hypothetical protein
MRGKETIAFNTVLEARGIFAVVAAAAVDASRLRSGVKGDAGFAGTDRCPFCAAGFHGQLTAHATRARVRSWPHNYGAASAKRRIPIAMEGELDKMVAPGPRASTPGQKVRRLAKVGEQVRGVGRRT